MRARDLMRSLPVVGVDSPVGEGADLLAREAVDAVFVVDDGRLAGIVTDLALLCFLLPRYVREDMTLARVFSEETGRELWRALDGKRMADLLPMNPHEVTHVDDDATLLEVAAKMCADASFLAAVWHDGRLVGGITSDDLITALRAYRE